MAQETDSQRALRKCFQEVTGEVSKYVILAKGVHAAKQTSQWKVAAGHKEPMSEWL